MKFQNAIIFDMDGTILDSMPAWENVGGDYLRAHGVTPPPDFNDIVRGMSFDQSIDYMITDFGLNRTPQEVETAVFAAVNDQYRHTLPLKPFAAEFIREQARLGVSMCVATATNADLARAAMHRLGMDELLVFVVSCDEVGAGKDRPDVFLESAHRLGFAPQEIWVFEDSLQCIRTAKKAGFRTVGVHDKASAASWTQITQTADMTIHSFEELIHTGK